MGSEMCIRDRIGIAPVIEEEEEEIKAEQQDAASPETNTAPISTAEPEIPDQEEMPVKTEIQPTENDSDDS